jgi:DNA-binding transcriptional regulator YbjK
VRTNPERRATLLDSAIDVLAARGARGLTFRAVDTEAGVPTGTTSNYFRSRDELLAQAGDHVFVRLAPEPSEVEERLATGPSRALELELMRDIVRRADADPAAHLAMLELRLEATRRPEIRATMTRHYLDNLTAIVGDHVEGGFPGDAETAVLLYLAMTGLLVEHLTLPELLEGVGYATEDIVEAIVTTVVPEA